MPIPFKAGREYKRAQDIHARHGGSRQSGISPSRTSPYIFIFTGESGEKHGYEDRFLPDGRFLYTGEGQHGDMEFVRGNKAIRDHQNSNRNLLLFEQSKRGYCRYVGEFTYLNYHFESRPDNDGRSRRAIVFELAMAPLEDSVQFYKEDIGDDKFIEPPKSLNLTELRRLAISGSTGNIKPQNALVKLRYRSAAVKRYALARANGICECCNMPAPFKTKSKEPYLEVHHLHRVADGGPDSPDAVAAICPNCHREVHSGLNSKVKNETLIDKIHEKEISS